MSVRAIKAGAEDFLSKPESRETLLEAIKRALVRYAATQQKQDQIDSLRSLISTLTPREAEVFALRVRGKPNKQIAPSEGYVRTDRQSSPPNGDAEASGSIVCGGGLDRVASTHRMVTK